MFCYLGPLRNFCDFASLRLCVENVPPLVVDSDVLDKTPIAAAGHFDVADSFVRDDDIRGVPQGQKGQLVADNFPGFAYRSFAVALSVALTACSTIWSTSAFW